MFSDIVFFCQPLLMVKYEFKAILISSVIGKFIINDTK